MKAMTFTAFIRKGAEFERRSVIRYSNETPGEINRKDAIIARLVKDAVKEGHDVLIRAGEHDRPFPDADETREATAQAPDEIPQPEFGVGDKVIFPLAATVRRDGQTIKVAGLTIGTVVKLPEPGKVTVNTEKYATVVANEKDLELAETAARELAVGAQVVFVKPWKAEDKSFTIPVGANGEVIGAKDAEGFYTVKTEQGEVLCTDEIEAAK
jgi:hypothetical protein